MGHSKNVFDTPYYTLREILPGFPKLLFIMRHYVPDDIMV